MKKILTGALAALTLGGALAATAVPASAAPWHGGYRGGYYHGGWHGGYGVATAGILGLAAGAAIADGYYGPAYYGPPPCRIEMRWNPTWGGYDRVRVCY
jgi:opacity protein-like surface antigen